MQKWLIKVAGDDGEHHPACDSLAGTKTNSISLVPVYLRAIESVGRLAQLFCFESNYSHPEFNE